MRGGREIRGGVRVAVYQPYLLDVDKVTDRLTRLQSTYPETVSLINGQRWRYRRTGNSVRPLVMLPGVQGGGSVFFDVALALGGKLDLITATAPPIVDAAAMADAQAEFLLALRIREIDLFGSSLGVLRDKERHVSKAEARKCTALNPCNNQTIEIDWNDPGNWMVGWTANCRAMSFHRDIQKESFDDPA